MKTILIEDALLVKARILEIEKHIFELGEEFNEAVNQSSETWHDNAPFDVVRDKQTLLSSERSKLIVVLNTYQIVKAPKAAKLCKVGTYVKLSHLDKHLYIGGDWTEREENQESHTRV